MSGVCSSQKTLPLNSAVFATYFGAYIEVMHFSQQFTSVVSSNSSFTQIFMYTCNVGFYFPCAVGFNSILCSYTKVQILSPLKYLISKL